MIPRENTSIRSSTFDYNASRDIEDPPPALMPATFLKIGQTSTFTVTYSNPCPSLCPSAPPLILDHPILKHIIGPYPPTPEDLANISYGSSISDLHIASDGSYYKETGGAGHSWLFATQAGKIISSGPGAPFEHLSFPYTFPYTKYQYKRTLQY